MVAAVAPALSYCVVNTNGREYLLACLEAIERTHPAGVEREVLVLDNASDDGSAEAVRALRRRDPPDRAGAADRQGGERLDPAARGEGPLLPAAQRGLRAAPGRGGGADRRRSTPTPRRPRPAPQLLDSDGKPVPCAWRFPGVGTALAGALFLHRLLTVQSKGAETRRVDWAQSSALMVRREAAAEVGYLDPDFFVYYDECDFAKRLGDAGWHSLFVPAGRGRPPRPALHRPRRRACRGSSSSTATATSTCESTTRRAAALAVRVLTAWAYAAARPCRDRPPRPAGAGLLGPRPPGALPGRGESLRERPSASDPGGASADFRVRRSSPRRVARRQSARRPPLPDALQSLESSSIAPPRSLGDRSVDRGRSGAAESQAFEQLSRVAQAGQPAALLGGEEAAERGGTSG